MKNIHWKGSALLAPLPPALVSCGDAETEKVNLLCVGWTGILSTQPPYTYIALRPSRLSSDLIRERMEFAVNLVTTEMVPATDFCGIRSGRDCTAFGGTKYQGNKFDACGLHCEAASVIRCPLVEESPVSLECRVVQILPKPECTHDLYIAEIVAVDVDEALLDKEGKMHLERCKLVAYAHGDYYELGRRLGSIGDSVRKTPNHKKRLPSKKK